MTLLGTSLMITLVGMGLVFGALLLLWALMELIVRVTPDHEEDEEIELTAEPELRLEAAEPPALPLDGRPARQQAAAAAVVIALASQQQRAAAAGVAVALASQARPSETVYEPPSAGISAWQAVLRAGQYNQRGKTFRK